MRIPGIRVDRRKRAHNGAGGVLSNGRVRKRNVRRTFVHVLDVDRETLRDRRAGRIRRRHRHRDVRLAFVVESETDSSPLNRRKRDEAEARLQLEDPNSFAQIARERNALIRSVTGIALPDPVPQARKQSASERSVNRPDPGQARALGNPMPEAELDAYRKQGLTDAQILERAAKKGLPLASTNGRPIVSSIPNRGSDFEGFSFQSAPVVKIADEDQTEEV